MRIIDWPALMWYGLLTGLAGRLRHPRAAVRLREHRTALALHHHGLGGDPACDVVADAGVNRTPRAGAHGGRDLLAWLERDQVHLPERINRFPDAALNRELYFWLAAWFALDRALDGENALPASLRHLFRGIATSARVLDRFPALSRRYARLCAEELAQRRDALPSLGEGARHPAHQLEAAIRFALGAGKPPDDAWLAASLEEARGGACPVAPAHWRGLPVPFLPVFLWGCRRAELPRLRLRWLRRRVRRRAHGMRESVARPRFDPELQPNPPSGALAGDEYVYREWDCRRRAYRPDWCRVVERPPRPVGHSRFGADVTPLAQRVRRQFEILREVRSWARGLEIGDDLDLEAFVDSVADRRSRGLCSLRLYRQRENRLRDLAVAVLLDASRSTAAWVGERRVIDVAKRSMGVLAEALSAAGDDFALYGFASDSRLRVRCFRLKGYREAYDDDVRRRIQALDPGNYTRMGAAIRHAGAGLQALAHARKLMIVLTDGCPHDPIDGYEGRYALEDTRRALQELRTCGVRCFGLTIDVRGRAWLPSLFGPGHYAVFSRPEALPSVLPGLYARITGLPG